MKKVLIITYYWPPSGGGGVQRWLKFTKYLPEFGWKPIIVTPEDPDFEMRDDTLFEDIPEECEELKLPIWEPYSIYRKLSGQQQIKQGISDNKNWKQKLFNWIRGNLFIPDPKIFWVRSTVKFLVSYLKERPVDLVVTTGPPHSVHLIGSKLKKRIGVKWLADFRDPWSDWDMLETFHTGVLARWRHRKLERTVLNNADAVLTVSEHWANELSEKFNGKAAKVITNGYDEEDFKCIRSAEMPGKLVLGHFGLLNKFRNPAGLWKALSKLNKPQIDFELNLYGPVSEELQASINQLKSGNGTVNWMGTVSHEEVLNAYQECKVLLLILNTSKNAKGHLPGKLFEYIRMGIPILAVGPVGSDADRILNETGAGKLFDPNDEVGITDFLLGVEADELQLNRDENRVRQFSRKELTRKLDHLLNDVI